MLYLERLAEIKMNKIILIVEDDALISRMYQKILSTDGYKVEVAINGEEGLQKAREIKPTLILLDA
jgi:DNA-binding response OmpR family regulator